jgi:hypothetical protein
MGQRLRLRGAGDEESASKQTLQASAMRLTVADSVTPIVAHA